MFIQKYIRYNFYRRIKLSSRHLEYLGKLGFKQKPIIPSSQQNPRKAKFLEKKTIIGTKYQNYLKDLQN